MSAAESRALASDEAPVRGRTGKSQRAQMRAIALIHPQRVLSYLRWDITHYRLMRGQRTRRVQVAQTMQMKLKAFSFILAVLMLSGCLCCNTKESSSTTTTILAATTTLVEMSTTTRLEVSTTLHSSSCSPNVNNLWDVLSSGESYYCTGVLARLGVNYGLREERIIQ